MPNVFTLKGPEHLPHFRTFSTSPPCEISFGFKGTPLFSERTNKPTAKASKTEVVQRASRRLDDCVGGSDALSALLEYDPVAYTAV